MTLWHVLALILGFLLGFFTRWIRTQLEQAHAKLDQLLGKVKVNVYPRS